MVVLHDGSIYLRRTPTTKSARASRLINNGPRRLQLGNKVHSGTHSSAMPNRFNKG